MRICYRCSSHLCETVIVKDDLCKCCRKHVIRKRPET